MDRGEEGRKEAKNGMKIKIQHSNRMERMKRIGRKENVYFSISQRTACLTIYSLLPLPLSLRQGRSPLEIQLTCHETTPSSFLFSVSLSAFTLSLPSSPLIAFRRKVVRTESIANNAMDEVQFIPAIVMPILSDEKQTHLASSGKEKGLISRTQSRERKQKQNRTSMEVQAVLGIFVLLSCSTDVMMLFRRRVNSLEQKGIPDLAHVQALISPCH